MNSESNSTDDLSISTLTGAKLSYIVWTALGSPNDGININYAESWEHSGPIIDKMSKEGNGFHVNSWVTEENGVTTVKVIVEYTCREIGDKYKYSSESLLVSALRCFVASKLAGQLIVIPSHLD